MYLHFSPPPNPPPWVFTFDSAQCNRKSAICGLKIPSGQRSRSPLLTKRIAASGNEIALQWKSSRFLSPIFTVARNAWDHDYDLGATQRRVVNSLRLSEVYYRKSYIKPRGERLIYFKSIWGAAYLRRRSLWNLETTMVSVLHKELECKVEKLKYKKLEVMQTRIRIKSKLPVGKWTLPDQSRRSSTVVID